MASGAKAVRGGSWQAIKIINNYNDFDASSVQRGTHFSELFIETLQFMCVAFMDLQGFFWFLCLKDLDFVSEKAKTYHRKDLVPVH